ncbi:hypothetical protein B5M09_000166 [Aphanomyces astaci]|uniref:J domain-containing protein n=1 Tax=Aphanomyces astaci TaxID=112090 RepID=A0A3R7XYA9_APHAT|nr:hypothetical protein B5M09_000166 [Aphanomyces astaci]
MSLLMPRPSGSSSGSPLPLFVKRPHASLERHLRLSNFQLKDAGATCMELKHKLDNAATVFRLSHTAMHLESRVASSLTSNREKSVEVRTIETFKQAAMGKLHPAPRCTLPQSTPPQTLSSLPASSNVDTDHTSIPSCQDPYFYLRPLQLHSLDDYDIQQLKRLVLSPPDIQTLHRSISKWLSALLDSAAYPSSPDVHMDMSRSALRVQYIALAAHYLGSHAYASALLKSKFGTTFAPFVCRLDKYSVRRAHWSLSEPLWPSGDVVDAAFPDFRRLVRATRDGCPEVLRELVCSSSELDDKEMAYHKADDEATYLQQCMWMTKLAEFAQGNFQMVSNGLKAIGRSILAIHRRQMLHRWRHDVDTSQWQAFCLATNESTNWTKEAPFFLRLALSPPTTSKASTSEPIDPTKQRSTWLQEYATSFSLDDAVHHLMDPATVSRMYRHGEKLQLGHYVLLDEEVNPTGADDMMDQLHATRQDLAKYDRQLAWHVWATTNLLADPQSCAFKVKPKTEALRPRVAPPSKLPEGSLTSPSLNTIQSRLQELALQLQHSQQHHEASKWIGMAIEQLGHHPLEPAHNHPPSVTDNLIGANDVEPKGNDDDISDDDQAVLVESPPRTTATAENLIDLTEDDDVVPPPAAPTSPTRTILQGQNLDKPSSPSPAPPAAPPAPPAYADERMYLNCAATDRLVVRQMGALFDADVKKWYVHEGQNLTPFSRWSPHPRAVESAPEPPSSPTASPPRLSTECMYFDCPYIERDQARSQGALWDSEKKLWVVPAGRNLKPFLRWTPRAPQVSTDRKYLDCPFPQKFLVKGLGAEWDPEAKAWFVPPGLDLARFTRWLPPPPPTTEEASPEPSVTHTPNPPPFENKVATEPAIPPIAMSSSNENVASTPSHAAAAVPVAKAAATPPAAPVRKISVKPLKRRAISHAAILSSCKNVLSDMIDSIERTSGCPKCKHEYLWNCVQCTRCKTHCNCMDEYRCQQNLRSEQASMFEAARRRARLLKQGVGGQVGPLADYTSCVTGADLVSTARILAMWRDTNMFGVLGTPPTASFQVVKRQYRSMVLQLHPDKSKHDTADKVSAFMAVTKAFREVKVMFGIP